MIIIQIFIMDIIMKNIKLATGKTGNDGKPIIQTGESNDDHVKFMVGVYNRKISVDHSWSKFRPGSIGHAVFSALLKFEKISVFSIADFYTKIGHDSGRNRNNLMVWGSNARTAGIDCISKYGIFSVNK